MAMQLSCVPFTATRFVARAIYGWGELRVSETEARRDAERMAREGFAVEVLRVEWEPVTGLRRAPRVVGAYSPERM